VDAALSGTVGDNATAMVIDVLALAPPDRGDIETVIASRPILPLPREGAEIDGFLLERMLADAQYSRVFRGRDTRDGSTVVLKFPKPGAAEESIFRQAYLRESWIAGRVRSPYLGEILEPPDGRGSQLYAVMPFYGDETLERRLLRGPPLRFDDGITIAIRLGKAVAALHRAGVIHRDIKPENVLLTGNLGQTGLRLIDLGVARLPNLEDVASRDMPGTPSYMAPELLAGGVGNESSDLYALGVTLWRMWSGGAYPYGEIEPFSHPRFGPTAALERKRPDLPAWLTNELTRAVAVDPRERPADVVEFVSALEAGIVTGAPSMQKQRSAYAADPLRFWKVVAALLFAGLMASLALR
jgi:serine/threonine protein kinase